MSVIRLPQPARLSKNGKAKQAPKAKPTTLAEKIDNLYTLRSLLRQSVAAEKELSAEISLAIKATSRDRAEGLTAVAILGTRTNLKVDPQLFLEAVGQKGYAAISVSVTAAREFMGEQDLNAIAEPIPTPVLRVEPKAEVAR